MNSTSYVLVDDTYYTLQEIDKASVTPCGSVLAQSLSQSLDWENVMLLGEKLFTLLSRCIVKYEPNPIGSQYHYTLLLSGDCKVFSYWWHVLKICHQESFADSLYPRSLLLPRNLHPSALPSTVLGLTIHLHSKCLAHPLVDPSTHEGPDHKIFSTHSHFLLV